MAYIIDGSALMDGEKRLLEVDNFLTCPVKLAGILVIGARDVLHSFAVPSLYTKMDAIPGKLNLSGLCIDVPGIYYGQCSELCGPNHGFMPIVIFGQPLISQQG
jgi:heme/copper-type cytochrome/quinol oxidase subunit 2